MIEAQINEVLAAIQNSVPQKWRSQLFRTVKKTPTSLMVVKKALKGSLDPAKRKQLEALLRSGELSKEERVLDERMAKKIDDFVNRKIARAVKLGQLPTKEDLIKLPFYQKYAPKEAKSVK